MPRNTDRRPRRVWPALLLGASIGLALPEPFLHAEEDPGVRFQRAVEALIRDVRAAAPEGVTAEVSSLAPAELGWDAASPGTSARRLVLRTGAGAERALGLMPRSGRYTPRPAPRVEDPHPALLAVGPELVVVAAPQGQPAALTLDVVEKARAAFEKALAPIDPWTHGKPVAPQEAGPALAGAVKATRYPHHVAVVLAVDAPELDVDQALATVDGLAWSRVSAEGILEPPLLAFRQR